ncbi:hypothetical protein [Reyranella sp.]|uniref:hypothetical protein n=1 Tax=Reyranella sp. TaxID=1929291 RepID=UPI003D0B4EF0
MVVKSVLAGLCLAGLSSMALAQGGPQPYGKGFDSWAFTRTKEQSGVTNCRGFRRVGGRDDILAMRTDGHSYLSVRAEGRKGKFPNSIVVPLREPANGMQWDLLVEADGKRMWMILPPAAIETIAAKGGYSVLLGGSEDRDDVDLGKSAPAAWKRVKECIVASGG